MIQKWVGVGRIGQDAEEKVFQSGNLSLKFSLAIDDSYLFNGQWQDRTYWIPIDVNLPSLVQSYRGRLLKGTLIWVEGKLCTYTFQDSTGATRTGFKIEAQALRIIPERRITAQGYEQVNTQHVQGNQFTPPDPNVVNYPPQQNTQISSNPQIQNDQNQQYVNPQVNGVNQQQGIGVQQAPTQNPANSINQNVQANEDNLLF